MRIENENSNSLQGKYPTHEHGFIVNLNTKIVNYFWKFIDILSCKMEKIAKMYEKTISREYEKEYPFHS